MQFSMSTTHTRQPGAAVQFTSLRAWQQRQPDEKSRECTSQRLRAAMAAGAVAAAAVSLLALPPPALASVPLDPITTQRSQALNQIAGRYVRPAPGVREPEQPSVREQVQTVMQLMQQAADASAAGDYVQALSAYTTVTQAFPDLAITEYSRIGRALMLFQLGRQADAVLQMQDEEVVLRGRPEVHAALAAMLWASGRPELRLEAERQWDLASEFDSRYSDVAWVVANKHWPPAMVDALQAFLRLS